MPDWSSLGIDGLTATNARRPAHARPAPAFPRRSPACALSVSSWRATLSGRAPSANLAANSCRRDIVRASTRLATFTDATSSRHDTAARKASSGARTFATTSSRMSAARSDAFLNASVSGRPGARCGVSAATSARAASRLTPGASRRVELQPMMEDRPPAVVDCAHHVRVEGCPRGNFLADRVRKGTWRQNADNGHRFLPVVSHVANEVPPDDARVPAVEGGPGAVAEHDDWRRSRLLVAFVR